MMENRRKSMSLVSIVVASSLASKYVSRDRGSAFMF